ncbi:hypothetical protein [Desulfosporosinus nitroreducens]|uniref:Uncharacterized protein n=2 Tax=Desulfosporosinus nitroreducens TaxID=2018668 RepID=A0ABT8QN48_9FIRM|nr:hypothetical protein [Desulfosporosinus nitroreducens]MDO0821523.1 hypothetical protein [Desulfosporosinus nitroreducens]
MNSGKGLLESKKIRPIPFKERVGIFTARPPGVKQFLSRLCKYLMNIEYISTIIIQIEINGKFIVEREESHTCIGRSDRVKYILEGWGTFQGDSGQGEAGSGTYAVCFAMFIGILVMIFIRALLLLIKFVRNSNLQAGCI